MGCTAYLSPSTTDHNDSYTDLFLQNCNKNQSSYRIGKNVLLRTAKSTLILSVKC